MKAKKLFTMYGKNSNIVTYEYRGMQYDVEYATNWNYCITPANIQHQDGQARIDKMIEQEGRHQAGGEFNADEVFAMLGWD